MPATRSLPTASSAAKTSPTRPRQLHRGHFAFMRALIQGVDTRHSWQRYLQSEGEHDDLRTVSKTIQWIRDEFAAAARRHDRFGAARLVQIDVATVVQGEPVLPSLEQFAEEEGIADFSQAEQIELYRARYGNNTQRQARRARLVAKQLEALGWLEQLVAQPPQGGDALAAWLHPDLVVRLEAAGIYTVRALVERINGLGARWWHGVRAIGPAKAERILAWLRAHEDSLGLPLGAHVFVKPSILTTHDLMNVVPPSTGIVPLDKLMVPAELDGREGLYRAPRHLCLVRADNDHEAVLTWIRSKQGISPEQKAAIQRRRGAEPGEPEGPFEWLKYLSHTQRAYLKEAERFLLWAIVEHRKPLSSMMVEDCEAYRRFLADPAPRDRWCGPRDRKRWSPLWRPFEGPLSPRAQRHAVTILRSLYKFLVDQCYLVGNPWSGIALPKASGHGINKDRSFSRAQWEFIEQQADRLPDTAANHRLRFALRFFYATGSRLAEGVAAKVDHLTWVCYPGIGDEDAVEGWELTVIGKGGKQRVVPVPLEIVADLARYLGSRGLEPDPAHPANRGASILSRAGDLTERAPWLPQANEPTDPKAGITAGTLYGQLKGFFARCATGLAETDPKGAERLAAASTHWLRHTHGAHAVAAGVPLDVLQQNLGHASLDTTTIYTTSEERRRMKATQDFWKQRKVV